MGRYQISCAQCHNDKFGKNYGGETLSQGHPLAYPVFKTGEDRMVTLHERFRMCNKLARADGQPDNSADYVALELFINWPSMNLPISAPGVATIWTPAALTIAGSDSSAGRSSGRP